VGVILKDNSSVVPLKSTDDMRLNETVTSFALSGFLVTPVMHKVSPDATTVPFLLASARRSNCVSSKIPLSLTHLDLLISRLGCRV